MILYHTSDIIVDVPDTQHSRDFLDFGKGFYLTDILEQAQNYGIRFIRRGKRAFLNVYEFEYEESQWDVRRFDTYNKDWLDFIGTCRNGNDKTTHDLIIGGIANDKVIRTLDRYFNGEINEEQALGLLIFERPNIQYCIRTQELLNSSLKYIRSEML